MNAVYGTDTATAQPAARFLLITRAGGQVLFNVIASAPSGSTITEYGIRYSTTQSTLDGLKGDDDVTSETAGSTNSNWLFSAAVSDEALAILQAMLFTVSFDANNGTGVIPPQSFVKDISAALNANAFTRNYYTFTGWNTSANGSGTSYQDGASVSLTESMRLYAQWQANTFALEYTLNGAADPGKPTGYTVESTITLVNPEKAGYTFTGWTGTDLSGNTATVTIPKGSTGARSYTANFTPITYIITYELNGGTNDDSTPTSYDIESAAITLKDPTKEGCDFVGWTLDGLAITEIPTGKGDQSLVGYWRHSAFRTRFQRRRQYCYRQQNTSSRKQQARIL